ncbi:hypothetical protein ABZ131_20695 [Providencia rettgeri]
MSNTQKNNNRTLDQALKSVSFFKRSNDIRKFCFWSPSDENNYSLGFKYGAEFLDLLREFPCVIGANLLHKVIRDMGVNIDTNTARGFMSMIEHTIVAPHSDNIKISDLAESIELVNASAKQFMLEMAKEEKPILLTPKEVMETLELTPAGYKILLESLGWIKKGSGDPTKLAIKDGLLLLKVEQDNTHTMFTEKGVSLLKYMIGR